MSDQEFEEYYKSTFNEPEILWNHHAQDVVWSKPYTSVLEDKESVFPKWFVGGEINMCYNCLDRHVNEGYGNDVAVIYDSPTRNIIQKFTYQELLDKVSLMAGVLVQKCGMSRSDNVFIYLPMIPEALIAILACTRIGAKYASAFAEFAPKEISDRLNQFKPKVIITSNIASLSNKIINYKKNMDDAIRLSSYSPQFCIVCNTPQFESANMIPNRDLDWDVEISKASPQDVVYVPSNHPLFISYTSGTTGKPKGLVIETGGAVVVNKYSMKYLFDVKPNETFFTMSNFSWILGQCLTFATLLSRSTSIIYEDKPVERRSCLEVLRILKEHKVTSLVTTPTVMRTMRKHLLLEDYEIKFENLKSIFLGGELFDDALKNWVVKVFQCLVCVSWGQTELGGYGIVPCLGYKRSLKHIRENTNLMIPGSLAKVVDRESGKELVNGIIGRLILKLPLTPIRASTIYENDEQFDKTYFKTYPGYFDTMDSAVFVSDNNLKIISRDDNIINVATVRINGFQVEEACMLDENLDQVAIIALEDTIKGFVPFGFLVPTSNVTVTEDEMIRNAVKNVSETVGEVACFTQAVVVPQLPKNVVGKTLRLSLEMMANGKDFKVPAMIQNKEVYFVIHDILRTAGYNASLPSDM